MRVSAAIACFALATSARLAYGQLPPLEATRAGPHPGSVGHGEVLRFARTFAAARDGDRLLVVYVENDGARGALRSALFQREAGGAPDAPLRLTRVRDDVTLAPDVRAVSLAWNGRDGAVAWVVPRVNTTLPPSERPRGVVRRGAVGIPASTADALGPSAPSGGDVQVLLLDGDGAPRGEAHAVATENARLWRAAIARDGDGWAVAWTGATVTDDEVRGTVRALRLRNDATPARAVASATSWSGDPGDVLRVVHVRGATMVVFTGARCVAEEGAPAAPSSLNEDPSAGIDAPGRNPQPQAPVRRAPGPPVRCGLTALHALELRADDTLSAPVEGPWLPGDAASVTDEAVVVSWGGDLRATVPARVELSARGFGAAQSLSEPRALAASPRPTVPPQSVANLTRPPPDTSVPVAERPVTPPVPAGNDTLAAHLTAPRALSYADGTLAALTDDRRALAFARAGDGVFSLLATTPSLFYEVAALAGPRGEASWVLAREGTWSGPLRFFALPPRGAVAPLQLPRALAAPPPPTSRPTRYATTTPYAYDEEFARLFVHTRTLRAQFMRHENVAGMMAARPEAPTDPRMPGLLAVRRNLQNRWEVACAALRRRAVALARAGAGDDVVQGVNQLCEIHAELRLGVPIDPSL